LRGSHTRLKRYTASTDWRVPANLCNNRLRFPKDNSETEIKEFSKDDLKYAFKYFKVLRKAFDLDKQISKLTRKK